MGQYAFTDRQELIKEGFRAVDAFGNESEMMRKAVDKLWASTPKQERINMVIMVYEKHDDMSIAYAAQLANVPLKDMKAALQEAGLTRFGLGDGRKTRAAAKRLAKTHKGKDAPTWAP